MKRVKRWLSAVRAGLQYTPLADREEWEVERRDPGAPASVWLRAL